MTVLTCFSLCQEELGMKLSAREAMRNMPETNKRKLLESHRPVPAPIRPSKTGPADAQGSLASIKRFSLASVGWGPSTLDNMTQQSIPSLSSPAILSATHANEPLDAQSSPVSPTAPSPLQESHRTPSSWTSWWSVASTATGATHVSEEAKDTPRFYAEQLVST